MSVAAQNRLIGRRRLQGKHRVDLPPKIVVEVTKPVEEPRKGCPFRLVDLRQGDRCARRENRAPCLRGPRGRRRHCRRQRRWPLGPTLPPSKRAKSMVSEEWKTRRGLSARWLARAGT